MSDRTAEDLQADVLDRRRRAGRLDPGTRSGVARHRRDRGRAEPAGHMPGVKCNHVAARTMEIFRRLGVGAVRDTGLPATCQRRAFRTTRWGSSSPASIFPAGATATPTRAARMAGGRRRSRRIASTRSISIRCWRPKRRRIPGAVPEPDARAGFHAERRRRHRRGRGSRERRQASDRLRLSGGLRRRPRRSAPRRSARGSTATP